MKECLLSILGCCLISCTATRTPKEEFRGVWIATVVNIDWPKDPKADAGTKKAEFLDILDFYQELNFNAAIVQVRTAGDAFYQTDLAPWSAYLSSKQGEAPQEFEAPLAWMIEQTHKKGMEFHAWLNPYRATFDLDTLALDPSHDFYRHPDWMVKYGNKYYYDPGNPEVMAKFDRIVEELVREYPLDAIHFDDYFYPYKIEGEQFEDARTFARYGLPGQDLGDWRRSNVDSLVRRVHASIKEHKPWVQFGISPFGVWKNRDTDPRGSDTQAGQTTYEDLYADPLLWVREGWLDYLAPQVYWSMDLPVASHRKIVGWWADAAPDTHLYIGNGTYKIRNNSDPAWNRTNEIPKQLALARGTEEIDGNIFFSAKSLMGKHDKLLERLKKRFYRYPALGPGPLNRVERPIQSPTITVLRHQGDSLKICIDHSDRIPRYLNLYESRRGKPQLLLKAYLSEGQESGCFSWELPQGTKLEKLGLGLRDAYGNESPLQALKP